ncbi:MAG: stage II sporulation protein M [Myxococcota bacterium]
MTREELVESRRVPWQRLADLLRETERARGLRALAPADIKEISELYRSLAADLMRVRRDKLGADLERYLDDLASRAHNAIYAGGPAENGLKPLDLLLDFPGAVRRNWRLLLLSAALFYVPMFGGGLASYVDESYALALLEPEQLEGFERMYREASKDGRDVNTDSMMTGFYVNNNVGIAFRCFATGIAFGFGSIYLTVFNGLYTGVVIGHLARVGLGEKIFSFISTHSAWELNAIVMACAAGIQMGLALVRTRGRTRLGNLEAHGLELCRQVVGAAAFLGVAAILEGNVSPSALPPEAKYALGVASTALVIGILFFSGRSRPVPADARALLDNPEPSIGEALGLRRRRAA